MQDQGPAGGFGRRAQAIRAGGGGGTAAAALDPSTSSEGFGRPRDAAGGGSLLSMADVAKLQQDRSPEGRQMLARRFGGSYDQLVQAGHGQLTDAILGLLVRDVEKRVRSTLAELVAASSNLPVAVAGRLARDDIEVARPILQESPVLDDATLVEIVRTNAMQYALAVAARENLSTTITDALVDTGHQEVVMKVVGNTTAKISSRTLDRIRTDWREDRSIQSRLVRRPELPFELVEHLVEAIGERLEWELVQSRRLSKEDAHQLLKATRERAAITLTANDHGDRTRVLDLRQQLHAGQLDHEAVLGMLRNGDVQGFEIAMSLHARLDVPTVRRLLYDTDRRHICALCIRAGFPVAHYLALRMVLELAEQSVKGKGVGAVYSGDTMRFLQSQFLRMQLDDATIDELVGEPAPAPAIEDAVILRD